MDNAAQIICTIIITAIGSSGLWSYLQYRADKKDKTAEALERINLKLNEVTEAQKEAEAKQAKRCILNLNDDLENGIYHSKDYFRNVLEDDIPKYEEYCASHPTFRNGFTVEAVSFITQKYHEMRDAGRFNGGAGNE